MDLFNAATTRQRNLRIVLFVVILGTLPLYCLGFLLWGTAPRQNNPIRTTTATATLNQSVIATSTFPPGFASNTPLVLPTQPGNVFPTPVQFFTPPVFPTFVIFPSPTSTTFIFIPPTAAPTLTPFPTDTPFPTATWTLIPPASSTPTDTQIIFPTDPPTFTPTTTPTETPTETATSLPFP